MRKTLTLLLAAIVAAAVWLAWTTVRPLAPPRQTFVLLRPGYSARHIAQTLEDAGVIPSTTAFLLWHYFHRHSLQAGEYLFAAPADIRQVHSRLARGDVYVHTVVVPEGFTIFDIAQAVQQSGLGSSQEFLQLAERETNWIADLDPQAQSLEGYLFPATYQFTRTESMRDIVAAMVKRFRQEANTMGLGGDVHGIVTMASIVEKETAVAEERPLVASVYYNRLAMKMALDADPSIIYGELLAGNYQGALHHTDMAIDSPYNTYRHSGLPPGPIGNPGLTSLQAAMHPARSDYYYFVSDGNGHHRFAHSLEQHNRNVAALRRVVKDR